MYHLSSILICIIIISSFWFLPMAKMANPGWHHLTLKLWALWRTHLSGWFLPVDSWAQGRFEAGEQAGVPANWMVYKCTLESLVDNWHCCLEPPGTYQSDPDLHSWSGEKNAQLHWRWSSRVLVLNSVSWLLYLGSTFCILFHCFTFRNRSQHFTTLTGAAIMLPFLLTLIDGKVMPQYLR